MHRRDFLKQSVIAGSAVSSIGAAGESTAPGFDPAAASMPAGKVAAKLPDLAPARWIWYPSERCLPNTFVLFRREVALAAKPRRATGWICADSRYRLEVNGRRVQWGPAPCDPRWQEADPIELTEALRAGKNVLGTTVLFYGQGDGTWPVGKPGFLFRLEIEHADGRKETIVSDASWKAHLARAWPPGHYKRWFLRALQEEFDARLYPYGWTTAEFVADANWLPALDLGGSPNQPSICTGYDEYQLAIDASAADAELRPRSIPLMRESFVAVKRMAESRRIRWVRPIEEYFECRVPGAWIVEGRAEPQETGLGIWSVRLEADRGTALTFEFEEQIVGWPSFTIEASAGTVVELLVHEAHQPGGPALLNTHFDSWTRFICREGENRFETFDFESLRWLQLHIHGPAGEVKVSQVGVRRRMYAWPNDPDIRVGDRALQLLMNASINTLHNCAQETLVDGMGRERQQYSGDGAHQMHAIHYAFGETRQLARFLTTFSQGMTLDGYFLDCWPAYDRLARVMERQLQLTGWGPILDHGVEFHFDCRHYYMYTGDLEALREPYPRLLRFAQYLKGIQQRNGLLPVENIGVPSVWIDHVAFKQPRHKQCAFNLYAAAAMEHALAPICRAFDDARHEAAARAFGRELLEAAVRHFWDAERGAFVNNRPWLAEEKAIRLDDRSLATSVLFDQCPQGRTEAAVRALVDCPAEMGFSYPCNAGWRLWALGKAGRADVILKDLRERWATMNSVRLNNTLQEDWQAQPDSGSQWSHCAVAPVYVLYMNIAGIRPLEPGFKRCEIRPQLGDLERLEVTARTVQGPLVFRSQGKIGDRRFLIDTPAAVEAELVVRSGEKIGLPKSAEGPEFERYRLPAGKQTALRLTRT